MVLRLDSGHTAPKADILELPRLASGVAPATVCAKGSVADAPPSRRAGWGLGPDDLELSALYRLAGLLQYSGRTQTCFRDP